MIPVSSLDFKASFKCGDIALVLRPGFAAWFQNLYANKFKEGPLRASHGFFCKGMMTISEADGSAIAQADIAKYVVPKVKMWVFRYAGTTPQQITAMMNYVRQQERLETPYSWGDIWEFVRSYFTGKRRWRKQSGEFCDDYTGSIILAAGLTYLSKEPWEVTPSSQLNWFMDVLQLKTVRFVGFADGFGNYQIAN